MKHLGVILAVCMVFSLSCSFDFLDDKKELASSGDLIEEKTSSDEVQLVKWKNIDGILQYYEEQYFVDDGSRNIDQIQRYSSSGSLQYTYWYKYNPSGLMEMACLYNSADVLVSSFVYTFAADNKIETQAEYYYTHTDPSEATAHLKGALSFTFAGSGSAAGKVNSAASFDGAAEMDGTVGYFFIPGSDKWNVELTYGAKGSALVGFPETGYPAREIISAGVITSGTVESHGRIELSLPDLPTPPTLDIPQLPDSGMSPTGYRFAYYDGDASIKIALNADRYPVSVVRSGDSKLAGKTMQVELAYDGEHRIVRKTTRYGSTMALNLEIEYDVDNYPLEITTTGKAMMAPLSYLIEYQPDHSLERISVSLSDTPVQYFTFDGVDPLSPGDIRTIDPFAIFDGLFTAGAVIKHYTAANDLLETFTAESVDGGPKIVVNEPTDEGEPGGETNGYYLFSRDGDFTHTISAFSDDGKEVSSTDFSLPSPVTDTYDDATGTVGGIPDQFGRLFETYTPVILADAAENQVAAAISKNFILDLLF